MCDITTSKISNDKFIGVCLFYVDLAMVIKTVLLSVALYKPSRAVRDSDLQASDILNNYVVSVLSEFNLSVDDIMSSTSDSGSDVKRAMKITTPGAWDWCFPHMCHCVFVDAFGISKDPAKSKNIPARALIYAVRKIVENFNKSADTKALFEEIQVQLDGYSIKLKGDASQRWKSTVNMLRVLLLKWNDVATVHIQLNKQFRIQEKREELIELYALMCPLGSLMTIGQSTSYPVSTQCLLHMWHYSKTLLNPDAPLPLSDPANPNAKGPLPTKDVAFLSDTTLATREFLRVAFQMISINMPFLHSRRLARGNKLLDNMFP
jgi:hypothetical protein